MKFLLDTSVFLWALDADFRLNARAREILTTQSHELFLSAVSVWEIAIKFALGSLPLPKAPSEYIFVAVRTWGLRTLDITLEHALRAGELPPHHRDPFDRMLIAQAATEKMTLLTADQVFHAYKIEMILCGK